MTDTLIPFLFEGEPIRGKLVRLSASWQAVLERGEYPSPVRERLGNAIAAMPLLASSLKLEGEVILQVQGDGPLKLLVAQSDHLLHIRGLARHEGEVPEGRLAEQIGAGRLVITLQPDRGQQYQGIVPLSGEDFASCLEAYFQESEQLPTRIMLANDGATAAGLMLQRVPGELQDADAWDRVSQLAATLTEDELLSLEPHSILHRLFHEEDVRRYEAQPVAFRCHCSLARVEEMLRSLGAAEVDGIIQERGDIEVFCEFCNRRYVLDPVDAAALFEGHGSPGSRTLQ